MVETEMDLEYQELNNINTTQEDLNAHNIKDDENIELSKDLKVTQDLNMSLDKGLEPDLKLTSEINTEADLRLGELNVESDLKPNEAEDKSQNNNSSNLIKELSIPIELDPNFEPEKVSYDINDLNIPIQLEEVTTPTTLNSLVKKLDIPCDNEAIKSEFEKSKKKYKRNITTRYSKRNEEIANGLSFRLNGLSYKNHLDSKDLSTSLNFRELSKKLDLNKNTLNLSNKLLKPSNFQINTLNLEDFSKLNMDTITNSQLSILQTLDSDVINNLNPNILDKLDTSAITKLDLNSSGNLDINDTQNLNYNNYLKSADQQIGELRPLNELNYKSDLNLLDNPIELSKLREINEFQHNSDLNYSEELGINHGVDDSNIFTSNSNLHHDTDLKAMSEMNYNNDLKYINNLKYTNNLKVKHDTKSKKKRGIKPKNNLINSTMNTPIMINQVEPPPLTVENWAQCENCKKWRRIPLSVDTDKLPDTWVCSLNIWDPIYNSCDIPEETYPEKLGDPNFPEDLNSSTTPFNSVSPDKSFSNESEVNYYPYVQDDKYTENMDVKLTRDKLKSDEYKPKYSETKNKTKNKYKSVKNNGKEKYYENKNKTSRRGRYKNSEKSSKRTYENTYFQDNVHTPTSSNRHYNESKMSGRRKMHISPQASNLSNCNNSSDVIRFKVKPTNENMHPLKHRMTLYSNSLTSLLATELPHSALFLDNLRRMNPIKNNFKDEDYDYDNTNEEETDKITALAREALNREGNINIRDRDNVVFKEDGNINLAYANKTGWDHLNARREYINRRDVKFNKEDIFDNIVLFEQTEANKKKSRSGMSKMYKRLSSQIPNLTDIVNLNTKSTSNGVSSDAINKQADGELEHEVSDNKEGDSVSNHTNNNLNHNDNEDLNNNNVNIKSSSFINNNSDSNNDNKNNNFKHSLIKSQNINNNKQGENNDSFNNKIEDNGTENNSYYKNLDLENNENYNKINAINSENINNNNLQSLKKISKTYKTRSSTGHGKNEANSYSYRNNINNFYKKNQYSMYDTYGKKITNGYDQKSKYGRGVETRNKTISKKNKTNSYAINNPYINGGSVSYEKTMGPTINKDFDSKTSVVNRDEILNVLYTFAKQYYDKPADNDNFESSHQQSNECQRSETNNSTEKVNEMSNHQTNFINSKTKPTEVNKPEKKSVLYCKRHKYVERMMHSIIDYKEQILKKLKREMIEIQLMEREQELMEKSESLKKDTKNNSEALNEFKNYDNLLNNNQMDYEEMTEKDDNADKLEMELENEFKKELLEKELESKLLKKDLMRNEKNMHLDYPLPNMKQLSKRCRNLETKSLRRSAQHTQDTLEAKLMSNYSMLFQPIPDDISASGSNNIIKMLSVPIPYNNYSYDYESNDDLESSISNTENRFSSNMNFNSINKNLVNGSFRSGSMRSESTRNGTNMSLSGRRALRGSEVDSEVSSSMSESAESRSLSSGYGGEVPFASGVVGANDLVNSGIVTNNGLMAGGSDPIVDGNETFKLSKFNNFDLLSLPIPDLTNTNNTQCVI